MRKSRLLALVALAALVAGLASACSSGGTEKKIGILLPETKTTRYEAKDRPIMEATIHKLYPDAKILYANANQDPALQQQQAEGMLVNGVDVMILDPVDSKSAQVIVKDANARNVPVIAYDRPIMNSNIAYYVSFDYTKVGEQQAQALVDAIHKTGKTSGDIVMINGAATDETAGMQKTGAHRVFDNSGFTIGAEYDTPDWSPDKAQAEMEQAITKLGRDKIVGVYSMNDGMASGVIAAMKSAGMKPLPPVSGMDSELAAMQRILDKEQSFSVYLSIPLQARSAATLAVDVAKGITPPTSLVNGSLQNGMKTVPAVMMPAQVVTPQTMLGTVVKDGYWKASDICTGPYVAACTQVGLAG